MKHDFNTRSERTWNGPSGRSGAAVLHVSPAEEIDDLLKSLEPTVHIQDLEQERRAPWLRAVETIASSRAMVFLLFGLLYALPTVYLAHRKLFWDDEFFTLYLSRTGSWHELLRSLATGADQHPPSFYYLTHALTALLGTSHVVVRLPAILGFALLCVCLYEIVRFLGNPFWAIVALLFPMGADLYYYATEARGYGLVAGFMALAVLAWLKATSRARRAVWLSVLALALAGAVGNHYYAAIAAACLCAGELARTISRRKVDFPVWIAFSFTALPIVAFLKTIQSARGYSTHFWAIPVWSDAFRFYQKQLGLEVVAVLGAVTLLVVLRRTRLAGAISSKFADKAPEWAAWQATALTGLALLPVLVMFGAKYVTHGYADRYAISAAIGVIVLLTYGLSRLAPAPQFALVAVGACLLMYSYELRMWADAINTQRAKLAFDIATLSRTGDYNIAVMDITPFHQLAFYAPRPIASRVAYVADPTLSIKYLGHDTVDRGLLELRPWFPIQVVPAGTYLHANPEFAVYGSVSSWNWLTYEIPKWADTELLARGEESALLLSVKNLRPGIPAAQPDPGFHDALSNQLAKTGPSLCAQWMGARDCM